jgi:hypothetical protein
MNITSSFLSSAGKTTSFASLTKFQVLLVIKFSSSNASTDKML